jgi:hypothetical protein
MTTRRVIYFLCLLCSCFLAIGARAQQQPEPEDPEDEKQFGLWLDQGISTPLSANKSLDVEFHERLDEEQPTCSSTSCKVASLFVCGRGLR